MTDHNDAAPAASGREFLVVAHTGRDNVPETMAVIAKRCAEAGVGLNEVMADSGASTNLLSATDSVTRRTAESATMALLSTIGRKCRRTSFCTIRISSPSGNLRSVKIPGTQRAPLSSWP